MYQKASDHCDLGCSSPISTARDDESECDEDEGIDQNNEDLDEDECKYDEDGDGDEDDEDDHDHHYDYEEEDESDADSESIIIKNTAEKRSGKVCPALSPSEVADLAFVKFKRVHLRNGISLKHGQPMHSIVGLKRISHVLR